MLPVLVVLSSWTEEPGPLLWSNAVVIAVIALLFPRDRAFPLGSRERWLVARAVLTGAATVDPSLDGYALRLLDRRREVGQSAERIALSLVMLVLLAAPIVAGTTSSRWWLSLFPLEVALFVAAVPYIVLDIDENIRCLEDANSFDDDA